MKMYSANGWVLDVLTSNAEAEDPHVQACVVEPTRDLHHHSPMCCTS